MLMPENIFLTTPFSAVNIFSISADFSKLAQNINSNQL
jgi:hypothetical protein